MSAHISRSDKPRRGLGMPGFLNNFRDPDQIESEVRSCKMPEGRRPSGNRTTAVKYKRKARLTLKSRPRSCGERCRNIACHISGESPLQDGSEGSDDDEFDG